MLGKKSGGLKSVSKTSTKSGKDMDKWGVSRNSNLCGAPERAFPDRDMCTRMLLPTTLEEVLSGPIPEKSIGEMKVQTVSHSSFFRCTQYQFFGRNRDLKQHFQ